MPRPNPDDIDRYHHREGIPAQYRKVLFARRLLYSAHAEQRYARRVEHLMPAASRPTNINAQTMRLLAADVVDGKVVMQVWRAQLAGHEKDLVLAVSDLGKVATVWVVERDDVDGIKRPKLSRAARRAAWLARQQETVGVDGEPGAVPTSLPAKRDATDQADGDAVPPPAAPATADGCTNTGWFARWAWLYRAIRDVLTHRRKNHVPRSCYPGRNLAPTPIRPSQPVEPSR